MSRPAPSAPLGIKVICVLAAIGAVLSLLGGLALIGLAGSTTAPPLAALLGVVSILLALLNGPMIYGLWTVKGWGWTLAMALYGLNVVLDVLNIVTGDASALLQLFVSLLILGYIASKADVYGKQSPL